MSFPDSAVVKKPPANAGDVRDEGLIPGLGRSSGERNGNQLKYSCLENSKDRGAWLQREQVAVWVLKSPHSQETTV